MKTNDELLSMPGFKEDATSAIDLSKYSFSFPLKNKIGRLCWYFFYWIFFRPFNLQLFNGWRNLILRLFGARLEKSSVVYASARVWAPWNLEMGEHSSMGPQVDCYNQGKISIGSNTSISQKTYLCASSHDFTLPDFPLILKPIKIEDQVWIAAGAFIGPGVVIGRGSVVGARSAVFKNIPEWSVVGGNPAQFIKERKIYKKKVHVESW